VADRERRMQQVQIGVRRRQAETSCELSRSGEQTWRRLIETLDGLSASEEDRTGDAVTLGHNVEAVVHAVDEIHVAPSGRAEHWRSPGGQAAIRVRRRVPRAEVRLNLGDPSCLSRTGRFHRKDLAKGLACD